ncbi:MAG: M20/M25/M40 family metallo-hydrolase [Planctomycetota bacterium]
MLLSLLLASPLQQTLLPEPAPVAPTPVDASQITEAPTHAVYAYGKDLELRDQLIRHGVMFDDLGWFIVGTIDADLADRLGVKMKIVPALADAETLYAMAKHHGEDHHGIANTGRLLWQSPDGRVMLRALTKAQAGVAANANFRCHGASRTIAKQAIRPSTFTSSRIGAITPDPAIVSWVNQVSQTNLINDVATMEGFGTRRHWETGEVTAQNWLVGKLSALGLNTTTFDYDSGGDVVIAELLGQTDPSKIVIVGGHYDSVNWAGSAGSPAPGADDDASGTAGVLEIARILSQQNFDYTIRFCAWSGEEMGLLGSEAYAAHLASIGAEVVGMVQLDMIAYRAPGDAYSVDFVTNDTDTNLNNFAMDCYAAYVPSLAINIGFLSGGTSDHKSFFNHGFPSTFPFEDLGSHSPYIHTPNDTSGTSANDFLLAERITEGALATVAELARPLSMTMSHTALGDTTNETGPYTAVVDVVSQTADTITGVDLLWRLEGAGSWNTVAMAPTGTPNEWSGDIPGIASPVRVEYHMIATNSAGTERFLPEGLSAGENLYRFVIGLYNQVYFNDFEGATDEGWTHQQVATQDDWQRGIPAGAVEDPGSAYSGNQVWANDLGLSGWNGSYASNVSNWLQSPSIDCSSLTGTKLRFARWLTVEEGQFDQATIEVNGTVVWSNPNSGNLVDSSWSLQDIDISAIADGNPSVTVRFTLESDGGLEFGGWNIDAFEIYTLEPVGGGGSMTLSGPGPVNTGDSVTLDVANAAPSTNWYLLYSFNNTGTTIFGAAFEVGTPWTLFHTGSTDAAGDGSHTFTVPPNGAGLTVYFEAATNAGSIATSNLYTLSIN